MTINTITIILSFIIFTLINIMGFILILYNTKKSTKPVTIDKSVEKIRILMEKDSIDRINDFVDALIKNATDKYMILHVGYVEDAYLKSADITELTLYTYGMVRQNMTKSVLDTIGLIYDVDTEEKLKDFLELRIKIYILAITVNTNKTIS